MSDIVSTSCSLTRFRIVEEIPLSPLEKATYITFALRIDTRRLPPAVLKKHTSIAVQEEEARLKEQGKKFVGRERKKELAEQVRLRLMGRFLPVPITHQVVWNTENGHILLNSTIAQAN